MLRKAFPLLRSLTSLLLKCNLSELVWAVAGVRSRGAKFTVLTWWVSGLAIYHECQMGAFTPVNEEGFAQLFCQSPEGTNFCSRLLLLWGKGLLQRALAPSACSHTASQEWLPTSLLPKGRSTNRNPVTYFVQRSPPLKHLQFVPSAVFVCRMSQEIREKAMYTKNIKNSKKNPNSILMFPITETKSVILLHS